MVSAMAADHPERWTDESRPYFEAKAEADKLVSESGLDYTIVRPGRLMDDPGTGTVQIASTWRPAARSPATTSRVLAEVLIADNTSARASTC